MNRFRVYVGPIMLDQYEDMFKAVPGITRVSVGTEHIYFDFDGSVTECTDHINAYDVEPYSMVLRRIIQGTAQLPGIQLFYLGKKP